MFVKIVFIADVMIIKTRLPNGFRAVFSSFSRDMPRKACLHHLPTGGKIGIALRQAPQAMQMIRQNDRRQQIKRAFCLYLPKRSAE
jgi:hypothetical protein